MNTILLVEDDSALALGMIYTFKNEGFQCRHAQSLEDARHLFDTSCDIVLLDVALPDGNGFDFCKEIRLKSDVPIIFLTSYDDEVNIVMGLEIGADDYVTKPFQLKVLISRIKANIRRRKPIITKEIKVGDLTIDMERCEVYCEDEKIDLTITEFKLIKLFSYNLNITLTRNKILEKLWDNKGKYIDENTISVHIKHIRLKLREANSGITIITARGIGYRMEEGNNV